MDVFWQISFLILSTLGIYFFLKSIISIVYVCRGNVEYILGILFSFAYFLICSALLSWIFNYLKGTQTATLYIMQGVTIFCSWSVIIFVLLTHRKLQKKRSYTIYSRNNTQIVSPKKRFFNNIHSIIEEVFFFSFVTYIILLALEFIKQGFVTYFLNLSIPLGIVLASGLLLAFQEISFQ